MKHMGNKYIFLTILKMVQDREIYKVIGVTE
jgi:hypothetical protein